MKNWNCYNEQFHSVFDESNCDLYYHSQLYSVILFNDQPINFYCLHNFDTHRIISIWHFSSVWNFVEYLRIDLKILSIQLLYSILYTIFLFSILYLLYKFIAYIGFHNFIECSSNPTSIIYFLSFNLLYHKLYLYTI